MTLPAALGLVLAIAPVQTSTADRALSAVEASLYGRWKTWERRAREERVLREDCQERLGAVVTVVRTASVAVTPDTRAEASGRSQEPRESPWLWFGAGAGVGALVAFLVALAG